MIVSMKAAGRMKARYNFRTVVGLIIRAIGLVALIIGGGLLLHWILWELAGGSRSFSIRPIAALGIPIVLLGLLCRLVCNAAD